MKRAILWLAVCLAVSACCGTMFMSDQAKRHLSQYGESVNTSAENDAEVWSRANVWVSNHSGMKTQIASDYLIETYNAAGFTFAYRVTRQKNGEGSIITVTCATDDIFRATSCATNTQAAVEYIATGSNLYPEEIDR